MSYFKEANKNAVDNEKKIPNDRSLAAFRALGETQGPQEDKTSLPISFQAAKLSTFLCIPSRLFCPVVSTNFQKPHVEGRLGEAGCKVLTIFCKSEGKGGPPFTEPALLKSRSGLRHGPALGDAS